MDYSDSLSEKYSLSSVIIGVAIWVLGIWLSSSIEPIELSLISISDESMSPLSFVVLLIIGMIVSLKSNQEQLNTFKVLGIILNWGMLVSIILLYTTN